MKADELGRRAVACKHWRWMPGMLLQWRTSRGAVYCGRVCNIEEPDAVWCEGREDRFDWPELPKCWPDLSDPATLGCLLHLVREAHEDADIVAFVVHSHGSPERWCVDVGPDPDFHDERKYVYRTTEVEALVAALEVAP